MIRKICLSHQIAGFFKSRHSRHQRGTRAQPVTETLDNRLVDLAVLPKVICIDDDQADRLLISEEVQPSDMAQL